MSDPKGTELNVAAAKAPVVQVPAAKPEEAKAAAPASGPEAKLQEAKVPEAGAAAKPAETKAHETKPGEAKTPETKAAPARAPEAKPAEARPEEAKPHPAKAPEAKAAAPKPAEAKAPDPKPAEAKAAETKPTGIPGLTRAPAAKPPNSNVNITITANAAMMIMGGLTMVVLLLGGLTVFLLVRIADRHPLDRLTLQVDGMDGSKVTPIASTTKGAPEKEAAAPVEMEKVEIGVNFKENLGGIPSKLPGSWPAFRGPNHDNIGSESVPLANRWPKSGPPVKWTIADLGEGYSGPSVHAGRVYLQDYDVKLREESLRCFSLEDGKEIWRRSYPLKLVNSHAFTRTVPAANDQYVVSMGAMCHVLCVDAQSGAMKWGINLMKDYGTRSMADQWYTAQCPIIDGATAVLAPCGKDVLMVGIDLETGKELWKTPNPKSFKMSHASVMPMTLGGKKMYVYCAIDGMVVGVSAEKDNAGMLLWESSSLSKQVIAPSPVVLEDGYVFITAGYGAGSVLLKVHEESGKYQSKIVWTQEAKDTLSCEQQTPVYYKKHLFALMPDSSGGMKQQLACMNPYDKGKIVWLSGKDKRFGQYEPILVADGKIFVMNEKCDLTLVKASPEKFEALATAKVLQGHDAWAPIALVGDRMLVRDSKVMVCLDVGKGIE
jgi:outer membrane protein assembly factor BamB